MKPAACTTSNCFKEAAQIMSFTCYNRQSVKNLHSIDQNLWPYPKELQIFGKNVKSKLPQINFTTDAFKNVWALRNMAPCLHSFPCRFNVTYEEWVWWSGFHCREEFTGIALSEPSIPHAHSSNLDVLRDRYYTLHSPRAQVVIPNREDDSELLCFSCTISVQAFFFRMKQIEVVTYLVFIVR